MGLRVSRTVHKQKAVGSLTNKFPLGFASASALQVTRVVHVHTRERYHARSEENGRSVRVRTLCVVIDALTILVHERYLTNTEHREIPYRYWYAEIPYQCYTQGDTVLIFIHRYLISPYELLILINGALPQWQRCTLIESELQTRLVTYSAIMSK